MSSLTRIAHKNTEIPETPWPLGHCRIPAPMKSITKV